jgi:oligopeptide/dipeptide ABC transporter ATP-binding protein
MQMVFQDPLNSLNPRLSAARSVAEPLRYHGWSRPRRRARIAELFEQVGLHRNTLGRYPAEMSGGQRQRVGLARALALHPKLLILDEPVSSLDVSVQAQILNLLQDLQHELGLSYLFISHNLSVVRYLCDRVAVMYLGKIVEIGSREEVYESPMHPYTQALLSAVPLPDPPEPGRSRGIVLTGELPSPANPPSGCRFRTRCWKSAPTCAEREPALIPRAGSASHAVACHFVETVSRSQAARGLGGSPDAAAKAADV